MAVQPIQLVAPKTAPDVKTVEFTASASARVRVDYCAWLNGTAANVTLSIWIGPFGGGQRIKDKTVLPGETYLCPEVIGALLVPGDELAIVCSAAGALYGQVNGTQFT